MQTITAIQANGSVRPATTAKSEYELAFEKAYETYSTKVFAFVYSRVRDVELARDVVAQVFERAYFKGESVRDQAAYGSWLFMVAKNLISEHYRKLGRGYANQDRLKDQLRLVDAPPEPEQVILQDERLGHLMRQVRTLPPREQQLISLKFDAELTHDEIGKVMGITALNVRVSIFRALKKLRERMQADDAVAADLGAA